MLKRSCGVGLTLACVGWASLMAQGNLDTVQVRAIPVAGSVYMLMGSGGNIGLSVGSDAAFLIDDQFAPLTPKIEAAVREITDQSIRFVLNTHWHGDHTGGNENLGKVGALIVAHDNVRVRMSSDQFIEAFNLNVPASPAGALPVVTFNDAVTFHLNDDEIHVFHVPPAHTDGDAVVHFRRANVVHMGDVYVSGGYPLVDLSSGGSIDGIIAAVAEVLQLSDGATKVIPGHGHLSDRVELQSYHDMLVAIRDRVAHEIASGKTRDEVLATKPTAAFDETWGRGSRNGDQFAGAVYDSLVKR